MSNNVAFKSLIESHRCCSSSVCVCHKCRLSAKPLLPEQPSNRELQPGSVNSGCCVFDCFSIQDELSSWEPSAAPLWGTFCGHCEGEWLGQYSAYTPWGGEARQQ